MPSLSSSNNAHHPQLNELAASQKSRSVPSSKSLGFPAQHVFLLLFAFRIVNALTLRTLYVPDEYYQSLEPAWHLAFGSKAGAWITWEWRYQLRSSLHPVLFASVYWAVTLSLKFFSVGNASHSAILVAAPKIIQALFAACMDFYTWRLAQTAFGSRSGAAGTVLAISVLSPWQWFCSTRTLSNALEAALTATALFYWPWSWMLTSSADELSSVTQQRKQKTRCGTSYATRKIFRIRTSLLLAATATLLRPTNVLVWIPVALQTLAKVSIQRRKVLISEAIFCGLTVAGLVAVADFWFYGRLTFPPYRFLVFNLYQNLAVFYGVHRWDYYITEGLPLLLLGMLPFGIFGLYHGIRMSLRSRTAILYSLETTMLPMFSSTAISMVFVMSLISHKEARFVYPLLPLLHVLAGNSVFLFLRRFSIWKGFIIGVILLLHVSVAHIISQTHQRGVIDVLNFLREQHTSRTHNYNTTVAFLMPCHSTPWRSHLISPDIDAWALTCEPPVNMSVSERSGYLDEADQFYASPVEWLDIHMEAGHIPKIDVQSRKFTRHKERTKNMQITGRGRPWPQYFVFFAQLETEMREWLEGKPYQECWRGFNSWWHDDPRRHGDVIAWCLSE